jgi:hypothetical protein
MVFKIFAAARPRMDRNPGRLVDHQDMVVFMEDEIREQELLVILRTRQANAHDVVNIGFTHHVDTEKIFIGDFFLQGYEILLLGLEVFDEIVLCHGGMLSEELS